VSRLLSDVRIRVGACVLAMAVAGGLGVVTKPKTPETRPEGVGEPARTVVNRTALSCPVPGAGGKTQSYVNAVAPYLPKDTPTAEGKAAPLAIGPLAATSDPVGSVLVRGKIASTTSTTKPETLSIQGTGPLAAGTTGTATATSSAGVNRGMASISCQLAGSDFWFVGASSAAGRRDVLVLTNLDSINAEVNVKVYSSNGALDLPAARGIVVPARASAELYLNLVAPKTKDLALHVESSGGRVAPALRDNVQNGTDPAGIDWLNQSAPPAKSVMVPGLASGAGPRTLTLANPSDLQATATLTVNGPNGPFKPNELSTVQIPAGSVKTVRLDASLRGEAAGITITSDQPITASARNVDKSGTDFSSLGAAEPLSGPAYVVLPPHLQPVQLQVTAPGKAASFRYELRDATGKALETREVDVVNGATSVVTLKPQQRPSYLMVEQTRGSVVAAATLMPPAKLGDDVTLVAAWPLNTSLVFRAQLGAQPDVAAALK
jgi:hypothetical protein